MHTLGASFSFHLFYLYISTSSNHTIQKAFAKKPLHKIHHRSIKLISHLKWQSRSSFVNPTAAFPATATQAWKSRACLFFKGLQGETNVGPPAAAEEVAGSAGA
jgi:hypothetical protein